MAKYTFNNHHNTAGEIYRSYKKKIQAVQSDDNLSDSGKARLISEVKAQRSKALSNLKNNLYTVANTLREPLNRKPVTAASARELLRKRALADKESLNLSYSDDVRADLIITAIENLNRSLTDFMQLQSIAGRSEDWFRKQLEAGLQNKDTARLEQLSRALPLLPDGAVSERLATQFTAVLHQLEEEALTPEQIANREELAEIDRAIELFDYRINSIEQRDEDIDPRPKESEPGSETILSPYVAPEKAQQMQVNGGAETEASEN